MKGKGSKDPPYDVGYRKPPVETRFAKGRSGNPSGRPKVKAGGKAGRASRSAFEVVLARRFPVQKNGRLQEASAEEAMQHAVLRQALKRDARARHDVVGMILARETAKAALAPPAPLGELRCRFDAMHDVDEALLLLGLVQRVMDPDRGQLELRLTPDTTQAALDRHVPELSEDDRRWLRERTLDADTVKWPKAWGL